MWWVAIGLVLALALPTAASRAELPQADPWQQTLHKFLASLTDRDVAIEVVPMQYIEEQLDDDARYRDWLLLGSGLWRRPGSPEQPNIDALRHPGEVYLLPSIERDGGVWMSPRQYSPMAPAWWSSWAYPGNPYFGSRACKLRGFIPAAVDMMMLAGNGSAPDTTVPATNLLANTYAYLHALDVLPNEVRQAFETAIGLALARLEEPTPTDPADASPPRADVAARAVTACVCTSASGRKSRIVEPCERSPRPTQ